MFELDLFCSKAASGLTLDGIVADCKGWGTLWHLTAGDIVLAVTSGVIVAVAVLVSRIKQGEDAIWVVLNTLEGLLYGVLAGWFGVITGELLAILLGPLALAGMLLVFALLSILVMIAAVAKGSAGGIKALGVFCHLLMSGALVVVAIAGFMVSDTGRAGNAYETYVQIAGFVFGFTAVIGAMIVSVLRGYHWAVGWLLVPINASWGALGNLLGIMNHFACLFYYEDWGKPNERRRWYVRYDKGFHLKSGFDFTEGDAMSGKGVETHEAIHVLQHFIAGPAYPLSHAAWMVLFFIPGIIAGAATRTVEQGIVDFTYYNNPWEVVAYAVDGTRHDSDANQPLIFNDIAACIIALTWICGAIGGVIAFLVLRMGT